MTQDRPTAAELVAAVREFLERDVMAATEGRVQFHTRVAVNVLGMVERELDARRRARRRASARAPPRCSATTATADDARARARGRASAPARSTTGSTRCARTCARPSGRSSLIANPGYLPDDAAVASAPHAHRDLERQLAEGPAPPRRGVPRLRRRRRAVPPGDEARRQELPRADVLRRSATSRCTTGRASGTASRSCRGSGSTNVDERLRRRARRSVRRRRAHRRRRRAAASAS